MPLLRCGGPVLSLLPRCLAHHPQAGDVSFVVSRPRALGSRAVGQGGGKGGRGGRPRHTAAAAPSISAAYSVGDHQVGATRRAWLSPILRCHSSSSYDPLRSSSRACPLSVAGVPSVAACTRTSVASVTNQAAPAAAVCAVRRRPALTALASFAPSLGREWGASPWSHCYRQVPSCARREGIQSESEFYDWLPGQCSHA